MAALDWNEGQAALCEQLISSIEQSRLCFSEAMSVINYVKTVFSDKGNNLLDAASIQEVAKQERFMR